MMFIRDFVTHFHFEIFSYLYFQVLLREQPKLDISFHIRDSNE